MYKERLFNKSNILIKMLQDQFFLITKVDKWNDFFDYVDYRVSQNTQYLSFTDLLEKLKKSRESAIKRGYFGNNKTKRPYNLFRKKTRKRSWTNENTRKKVKTDNNGLINLNTTLPKLVELY